MQPRAKYHFFLFLTLLLCFNLKAQDSTGFHHGRFISSVAISGFTYAGSLVGLNQAWYKQYPRSAFHFFNDNSEWGKMDKFGHAFTAYQLDRLGYNDLNWCGVNQNKSVWMGGTIGLLFLSSVEVLDGFSAGWGFSWGDMSANISGTAFFIAQQKIWQQQRISFKYAYHRGQYVQDRPDVFGDNFAQQLIKDYNGQTYWLSVNINSFTHNKKFIPWLNVALGYSCDYMYYGQNPNYSPDGLALENPYGKKRSHNVLLSLDVDFTKIPTHKKWLKTVFGVMNIIKIPFPAVAYREDVGFKGYWFYF